MKVTRLTEALLENSQIPHRFLNNSAWARKEPVLPKNPPANQYTPEETTYLDSLETFDVDGEEMDSVTLPPSTGRCVLIDFNTGIPWLCDTEGYDYPRYVLSLNGYVRQS